MDSRRALKLGVLAVIRALGGFAVSRWLTSRQLRILCYHGGSVGDERFYNPKLFCTADHVLGRLDWLKRKSFLPMSLSDAVQGLKQGGFPGKRPVVITVDDGWYSSKAAILAPCLENGFPVTLYVATQVVERGIPVLDVSVNYMLWRLGRRQVEVLPGLTPLAAGLYDLADPDIRRQVYDTVIGWLRGLPPRPDVVSAALDEFARVIGLGAEGLDLQSRRFSYLESEELRHLADRGCAIELHGHEHRYPLGRADLLRDDILACRAFLLASGLPEASHYCFPSGEFDDLAPAVFEAIGVVSGTTCLPGLIDPSRAVSLAYLPRFLDGGSISSLEFEAEMSGVLQAARALVRGLRRPPQAAAVAVKV